MNNELYKRTLYTKKVRFIINEIYEYDIAKANISILLQNGCITKREYNMFLQMPKFQREVVIGRMQQNPVYSKIINDGFTMARKQLIETNNLSEDDIVSIKKDAFYVLRRLHTTTFGNIDFTLRNQFNLYMYCRGIEIYYGLNELDSNDTGIIDIKGINDDNLQLHMSYLSFLAYIFKFVLNNNIPMAIQELMMFMNKYDNRELDIEYYREFNAKSMYNLGKYGISFIDESYKDILDISNNQLFNRELFSILMDIQYRK